MTLSTARRSRTANATRSISPAWGVGVWFAAFVAYLVVFYATPLSVSTEEHPVRRVLFLLLAFTPEFYLNTWTGGGTMRLAVLDRLPVLLTAGGIVAWGTALGWAVLELAGLARRLTRGEVGVFSMGVGLNLLSLATLAAGLIGWLHRPLMWLGLTAVGTGALLALAVGRRGRTTADAVPFQPERQQAESTVSWAWLALGAPVALMIIWGATAPPWEFDVREYHLQAPKEWLAQGAIDFMPHNVYANMPLGAEMHALLAMSLTPGADGWWWGALAGKTTMASFALLTAAALVLAGRRFFSPLAGVVAALVYLSVPWITHTATAGLNDHVLACYVFLGCYALLLWRENPARGQWLALAGFLAGAAAACKYTGLLFAVAPLGFLAVGLALRRKPEESQEKTTEGRSSEPERVAPRTAGRVRTAFFAGGCFAAFVLLGGGLWYAKNAALAGNPVYPLLYNVFGGRTWSAEKDARWRRAHQVPRSEDSGPYSARRLAAAVAQIGWRGEWLSPVLAPLLLLAPLAGVFGRIRQRRTLALVAGMALFILAAWWLLTHRIDRFWLPAFPLLALAAGAGADWSDDRRWRRCMLGVAGAGIAAGCLVIASPWVCDSRFLVALDALRTDVDDPAGGHVGRVNLAHHYLNQNVPSEGVVLLVGDAQPFDLERPALYNTCFDDVVLQQLIEGRSVEERRAALHARRITHVFVHWGEIARYRSPGNYGYPEFVQPAVFDELVRQNVLWPAWPEQAFAEESTETGYPPPRIYEVRHNAPQSPATSSQGGRANN